MAIKSNTTTIEIVSEHDGFLEVNRHWESDEVWLTITGDNEAPLILSTDKDIDDVCKALQECKKLLKK